MHDKIFDVDNDCVGKTKNELELRQNGRFFAWKKFWVLSLEKMTHIFPQG